MQQSRGVGMFRSGEHVCSGANFRDSAGIENEDAIRESGEKERIMSNQNQRETATFANRAEKLQHVALGCGIERCSRFIGDEEGRSARDGLRDQNALALASAQLMRKRAKNASSIVWKYGFEDLERLISERKTIERIVRGNYIADLLSDANHRVQRGRRLLQNQADAGAANIAQFAWRRFQEIFAVKHDDPSLHDSVRRQQAGNCRGERAFSRAGFPEHAENFARREFKFDTRKRGEKAAVA